MVALDFDDDPITLFGNMSIHSLLIHCLRQIEMALRVLIVMLKDNSFSDDYPLIPRRRHRDESP